MSKWGTHYFCPEELLPPSWSNRRLCIDRSGEVSKSFNDYTNIAFILRDIINAAM